MKYIQKARDFYQNDPKMALSIIFGMFFLIQLERLIYTIDENGYYEPAYLNVNVDVDDLPAIRIDDMPSVRLQN